MIASIWNLSKYVEVPDFWAIRNGLQTGWEFFNIRENRFHDWENRLSFDWTSDLSEGLTNTLDIFQEGNDRHIDIRIWFDELSIFDPNTQQVPLAEFINS